MVNVYDFAYTICMSIETTTTVRFNPQKFKAVRGSVSRSQFAERLGFKADYLGKIERGERALTLEALERLCAETNKFPNDFFDIEVK